MEVITLNPKKIVSTISDTAFLALCKDNEHLRIERDRHGNLEIMPPVRPLTDNKNSELTVELGLWNRQSKLGKIFGPSAGFKMPNTAIRMPDVGWISIDRWQQLSESELHSLSPICPDFVIELRSATDSLKKLQAKMLEWIDNGCQLAWLIDPTTHKAYIYRANGSIEIIDSFQQKISGENVLPGFELDLQLLID